MNEYEEAIDYCNTIKSITNGRIVKLNIYYEPQGLVCSIVCSVTCVIFESKQDMTTFKCNFYYIRGENYVHLNSTFSISNSNTIRASKPSVYEILFLSNKLRSRNYCFNKKTNAFLNTDEELPF